MFKVHIVMPLKFKPFNQHNIDCAFVGSEFKTNSVVEFQFDKKGKPCFQWKPMRTRERKTENFLKGKGFGNDYTVGMDVWNTKHHNDSGLIERVKKSKYDEGSAEKETIDFLRQYVPLGASPMCGNSICQDRRFMGRFLPSLVQYFHYRNLDVSTLKILMQNWRPDLNKGFIKKNVKFY